MTTEHSSKGIGVGDSKRYVRGTVTTTEGAPVAGAELALLRKRLRCEDEPIAEPTRTDQGGGYVIAWAHERGRVDIFVRVIHSERVIATSPVILNAGSDETVDLVVGGAYRGPSDFEKLHGTVARALEDECVALEELADLDENDVALLAAKTGVDPRDLVLLRQSAALARETKIPTQVLYALGRQKLPLGRSALLAHDPEKRRAAVQRALDQNQIPPGMEREAHLALARLDALAVAEALRSPRSPGEFTLGGLLAFADLPDEKRQKLVATYVQNEGPVEHFWARVRQQQQLTGEEILRVQFALQLGVVTQHHLPLVRALRERGVEKLADLARLELHDWIALIRGRGAAAVSSVATIATSHAGVGVPADLAAAGVRDDDYALMVFTAIEDAFPTAMIAHHASRLSKVPEIEQFYAQNPAFEMRATPVGAYLSKNPAALDWIADEPKRSKVVATLKGIERAYRIAPRGARVETMRVLLEDRLDSAQKIQKMGRATFLRRYERTLGSATARQVLAKAGNAAATAALLLARHGAAFDRTPMNVLPARVQKLRALPDYQSLFGSLDSCSCEHCQSVYSPSAYLVDVLHWLDLRASKHAGKSALDILFENRRADLGTIELSCKNTNTPLPYIDLVNEILELTLAPPGAAPSYQTKGDPADLAAHPEHLHAAAYEVLAGATAATGKDAVYPFDLPFDLWLAEARVYLGQLGVPRHALMEALHGAGPDAALTDVAVVTEALELSALERDVIAGKALNPTRSPEDFWGLSGDAGWVATLNKVSVFLDKATPPLAEQGLDFEALSDLLRADFVQKVGKVGVWFDGYTCDTTKSRLVGAATAHFDRLHRFLRLQRRLGWSAAELDRAITILGAGTLDQPLLARVAQVRRLQTELNVALPEVLTWWGPLDTRRWRKRFVKGIPAGVPAGSSGVGFVFDDQLASVAETAEDQSFYDLLFQSRTVTTEPPAAFRVKPDGTALVDESRELSLFAPAVTAALGITADDLGALLPKLPSTKLTLDNLSRLYRHVSLARTLELGVRPLVSLLALTNIDPFAAGQPEDALRFVREVRAVLASGFAVEELDYLLRHVDTKPATLAPEDPPIGVLLLELRDALRKIHADHSDPARRATAAASAVIEKLGSAIGLDPAVAAPVLREYVLHPGPGGTPAIDLFAAAAVVNYEKHVAGSDASVPPAPADLPAQFDCYKRLVKVALVLARFEITPEEIPWVFKQGPASGTLDFINLPIAAPVGAVHYGPWARLRDAVALRNRVAFGRLFDLFDAAAAAEATGDDAKVAAAFERFLGEIEKRTRWNRADVEFLVGAPARGGDSAIASALGWSYPANWKDERALGRLEAAMGVIRRVGLAASTLWPWRAVPGTLADERAQADAIKQAARARYEVSQWRAVARPLRDQLRARQREALAGWLIAHDGRFADTHVLYEHLLLDVGMSPCQLTSRVKQAMSSVQLFVQRALMNLEPNVTLSTEDAREWKWLKSYRVSEANRKVFLYPENWIEPELLDLKTPFFKQFESELLQGEVTDEAAENALRGYLEKLDEVARLEVVGMFHQNVPAETTDVLHVFARTRGTPPRYFYRTRVDGTRWTPWEKVEVDIEGDHLLPIVHNRRLYIFWAQIMEAAVEEVVDAPETIGESTAKEPERYYQLRLSWSELKRQKWLGKKLSTAQIGATVEDYRRLTCGLRKSATSSRNDFFFRAFEESASGDLIVEPIREVTAGGKKSSARYVRIDAFRLSGCDGTVTLERLNKAEDVAIRKPDGTNTDNQSFARTTAGGGLTLPARNPLTGAFVSQTALGSTPLPLEVVPTRVDDFQSHEPFFFQDLKRSFFVEPHDTYRWVREPGNWVIGNKVPLDIGWLVVETSKRPLPPVPDPWQLDPSGGVIDPSPVDYETRAPLVSKGGPRVAGLVGAGVAGLLETFGARVAFVGGEAVGVRSTKVAVRSAARVLSAKDGSELLALRSAGTPRGGAELRTLSMENTYVLPGLEAQDMVASAALKTWDRKEYRFEAFYHPYLRTMVRQLNRFGLEGLLDHPPTGPEPGLRRQMLSHEFFAAMYAPVAVSQPYPKDEFDFAYGGAYSAYNWELFFHVPFGIACYLSKNQRFEEAQRWFHFIFDPTESSAEPAPRRFWKTRPFSELFYGEDIEAGPIHELLLLLHYAGSDPSKVRARDQLLAQVTEWRANPFNPHAIARLRLTAYQKAVVMKYVDNLIEWGDQLFRRDTMETINEATQLYVLAAQILGRRPRQVTVEAPAPRTFNQLRALGLDAFSNAAVEEVEGYLPEVSGTDGDAHEGVTPVFGPSLYFCVPPNDRLVTQYWDRVADRLFKIRHCMNIEGVVRQLALFEPPIDPALLVRAAAAGIDLGSALSDLAAPLPHYRYQLLSPKALELCGDVKALGQALLLVLEKKDVESLSLVRAEHEIKVQTALADVREKQVDDAKHALDGLKKNKENANLRVKYYQSREKLNTKEKNHLAQLDKARGYAGRGETAQITAQYLSIIPSFSVGIAGFGGSPNVSMSFGGSNLAAAASAAAGHYNSDSAAAMHESQKAGILGGHDRRWDDWQHQCDVATKESEALDKQIIGATVRVAMAEKELANLKNQIDQSSQIEEFLRTKYTNEQLYGWMLGQLSTLYFQSYQLAYDLAKRAERAWQFELGLPTKSFVQFGYWDGLKKGLLAGDRLHYDLRRMEAGYLDANKREYELTRHVSLRLLDPVALLRLRRDGECFVQVPEEWFDLDSPGHYMRRIKSVAVSVPSVTGPYVPVRCTLTLVGSSVRVSTDPGGGYARAGTSDPRFRDDAVGVQSIVTSKAQEDSGLFDTALRDERYLPFEGAGAISEWKIELPKNFRQFDYDTISDVLLHMRYTAREGGVPLRQAAEGTLKTRLQSLVLGSQSGAAAGTREGLLHVLSAAQDAPDAWYEFLHPAGAEADQSLALTLGPNLFPYAVQGAGMKVASVELVLLMKDVTTYTAGAPVRLQVSAPGAASTAVDLTSVAATLAGAPRGVVQYGNNPKSLGAWTVAFREADNAAVAVGTVVNAAGHLRLNPAAVKDLLVAIRYKVGP